MINVNIEFWIIVINSMIVINSKRNVRYKFFVNLFFGILLVIKFFIILFRLNINK